MTAFNGAYKLIGLILVAFCQDCFGNASVAKPRAEPTLKTHSAPSVKTAPPAPAPKLPKFSHTVHGSVSATTKDRSMNIKTGPARNVADFHSFNIAKGHKVEVNQKSPGSQSVFRVKDEHPSNIWGKMNVNQGQVYLAGTGFIFHEGSTVNASNLVAAAAHVSDASARNFANGGNLLFDVIPGGSIFNRGEITIDDGGILGFVGANITEEGLIKGKKSQVNFFAGEKVWVEFDDDIIGFRADGALEDTHITVSEDANIVTEGGDINMTLVGMDKILRNTIRVEGHVAAGGSYINEKGEVVFDSGEGAIHTNESGNVVLDAGEGSIDITGTILTKGSDKAGDIKVKGKDIALEDNALLDASADHDAGRIEIGGTREIIKDYTKSPMGKPIAYADTVTISPSAKIMAKRFKDGKAGQIFMVADKKMDFRGTADVESWGKGAGGLIELSQLTGDFSFADINPEQLLLKNHGKGLAGKLLLDPATLTVAASGGDLTASTLQSWLALGSVILEATTSVTIDEAITNNTVNDLVIASDAITINENISHTSYGNLVLWATGTTTPDGGATISSSAANRNFVMLSRTDGEAGVTLGSYTITDMASFILDRRAGGDGVTLSSGSHYTSNITNGALSGTYDSRTAYKLSSLRIDRLYAGTADARDSEDIIDGTTVGTLGSHIIIINGSEAIIDRMSSDSLFAYVGISRGDMGEASATSGRGTVANLVASGTLYMPEVLYTVDGLTSTDSATGGIVGLVDGGTLNMYRGSYIIGGIDGITSSESWVGGVAGIVNNNINIINSTVFVGNVTGDNFVGGLVGEMTATAADKTITITDTNITGIGNLTGQAAVGGLIGVLGDYTPLTMTGTNTIDSIGNIDGTSNIGGLFGAISTTTNATTLSLISDLAVTSIGTVGSTGDTYVGGLVGRILEGDITISNLTVGTIGAISGGNYVGGLFGSVENATGADSITLSSSNITTIGAISSSSGSTYTGGVAGDVTSDFFELDGVTVGTITSVTGDSYLGGLFGRVNNSSGKAIVDNSTFTTIGNITASGATNDYVGGVVGEVTSDEFKVFRDTSIGTIGAVSGSDYVGGLVGKATSSGTDALFQDFSVDSITSVRGSNNFTTVGGLVGKNELVSATNGFNGLGLRNVKIGYVDADGTYLFSGYSSGDVADENINVKYRIEIPSFKASSWEIPNVSWDSITAIPYGVIAGEFTGNYFSYSPISGAPDVHFSFFQDGNRFTQWNGGVYTTNAQADSLTTNNGITVTRDGTEVMRLIYAEPNATIGSTGISGYVPYESIQIRDSDESDYRTYDYDIDNPVDISPGSAHYTLNESVTTQITGDRDSSTDITITEYDDARFRYDGSAWKGDIVINSDSDTEALVDPDTRGFTYNGSSGVWEPDDVTVEVFSGGGTQTTDPTTVGYSYDSSGNGGDGAWVAVVEGTTTQTPGSLGFRWDGALGAWKALVEDGFTTTPAAEGYVYRPLANSWQATIEDVNNVGETIETGAPGAAGFEYNGTNWVATVEGGTTATPAEEGFRYISSNWVATVEDVDNVGDTTTTTTPGAEGFAYNGTNWVATVEDVENVGNTTTTTTPAQEGFRYISSNWVATVEGGTTTTPAADGFTNYDGTNWLATVEGGLQTATPAADGFTTWDNTNWLATVEDTNNVGSTTTTSTPAADGFTDWNGTDWRASVETGLTATPAADGFTDWNGTNWRANVETGLTATPITDGFTTWDNTNWLATVEDDVKTATPIADGFTTWDNTNWLATVEDDVKTATPAADGFTDWNGTNWIATVEGGTTATPAAEGFTTWNGTSWLATVEDVNNVGSTTTTSTPAAEGFSTYNGTSWLASIESGASATPAAQGFNYNGTNWVATIETGPTTTPGAKGYAYNDTEEQWEATVEPGIITTTPGRQGYTYINGQWVAVTSAGNIVRPFARGYQYINGRWKGPKVNVAAGTEAIEAIEDTKDTDGIESTDLELFDEPPQTIKSDEQEFGPRTFSRIESLDALTGDMDNDGVPDEAERVTGIN